jgi:hypothetical protein
MLYRLKVLAYMALLIPNKSRMIARAVRLMKEVDRALAERKNRSELTFAAAVIMAKGRRLLTGTLRMILNGLDQDAGALLRPAIEAYELIEYLREVPKGMPQLLKNKLPPPGKIAAAIGSGMQPLREYLNTFASHVSVSTIAGMTHSDRMGRELYVDVGFDPNVLERSLRSLLVIMTKTNHEGVKVLEKEGILDQGILKRHKRLYAAAVKQMKALPKHP